MKFLNYCNRKTSTIPYLVTLQIVTYESLYFVWLLCLLLSYSSNTPTNLCTALLSFSLFRFILYCYAFVQHCNVKTILCINLSECWTTLTVFFFFHCNYFFSFSLTAMCRLSRDIKCYPHKEIIINITSTTTTTTYRRITALSRAIYLTIYSKKKGSIILFFSSQYTWNIDPPSDFKLNQ